MHARWCAEAMLSSATKAAAPPATAAKLWVGCVLPLYAHFPLLGGFRVQLSPSCASLVAEAHSGSQHDPWLANASRYLAEQLCSCVSSLASTTDGTGLEGHAQHLHGGVPDCILQLLLQR